MEQQELSHAKGRKGNVTTILQALKKLRLSSFLW